MPTIKLEHQFSFLSFEAINSTMQVALHSRKPLRRSVSSNNIILDLHYLFHYSILEIKPCGLGSSIRDMEAESYNRSHLLIGEHLDYFLFLFVSRTLALWDEPNIECQSVRSLYGVRPLAASMEVKNNHAHVTTPIILYKFIEVNFSVGCMVWP